MHYVGVDLHKHSISVCDDPSRHHPSSRRPATVPLCGRRGDPRLLRELGPFELVVEATASYEWFDG